MGIWVLKPAERDGGEMVSGVTTFESTDDSTTLGTYFSSSGALASGVPRAGFTTDQISDADWYDNGYTGSSVGFAFMLFEVTAIGSNSSPTISDLNNDQLITTVLHSSASGNANGVNHYNGSTTAYTMDWNNQSLTSNGTTYSLSGLTQITGNASPGVRQRTQDNTEGDVYYNGILYGSQSGGSGGSGNEDYATDYWSKTDFQQATVGAKSQVISKISTNSNDILEYIVKKSLTQNQIRELYVQLVKDGIIT